MAFNKYNTLNILVLTVYVVYSIPVVAPQNPHALSVSLSVNGTPVYYHFDGIWFEKFYQCLRNKDYAICDAVIYSSYLVFNVRGCPKKDHSENNDGFTCKPVEGGMICKRGENSPDDEDDACLINYSIDHNAPLSHQAQMTWVDAENVEISISAVGIMRLNLPNNKFVIQAKPITVLPTVMTATPRATTQTGGRPQTPSPSDSFTTGSSATGMQKSDDGDDNNNLAIIIGAAAGGVVVLVIIVIIFWRCKRRTSSSPTSNNKEYEDTDIYPYGDSTLSTIEPNLNSNSLNTNPNRKGPIPDMYAVVDPNKKPNEVKSSSGTNNANRNNENQSQQKKPRFNQSLDYTEVDIDNDAGHYQSNSVVNDGQGVANRVMISPSAPPYPSAKPSHYNISSETGENSGATYSQVIKTNKTKDASTINENVTGSNPARDPSGYEEAVLRTDTQYTTVDPSDNNTTIPAPDGVYAKLHDPVRNITDVYNEWPATDNAGK